MKEEDKERIEKAASKGFNEGIEAALSSLQSIKTDSFWDEAPIYIIKHAIVRISKLKKTV